MSKFRLCAFADEADKALDGQIKALRENNMDLIEVRGVDGKNIADLSAEEAKVLRKRLDDGGISVWSIGSPIGKVKITSPRQEETDRFMRVLETAVICGAENIRLFSFYGTEGKEEYLDEVCERLSIMLEKAKGTGVSLCHENEKGIYGDTAPRCAQLHEALPELRGIFDPANYIQCGQDPYEAWKLVGKYIKYAHVKDATAEGTVVPAGTGVGRLPELIQFYEKAGISVLSLEPHLKVFEGLSALEDGKTPQVGGMLAFRSGREAFDYAAGALRGLLD